MNRSNPTITALLAAMLWVSPALHAEPRQDAIKPLPASHMDGMPPPGMPPMLQALKLSDAQDDKLFALMHEQAPLRHEKMKLLQHARADLDALSHADQLDAARLRQLSGTIAQTMAELQVLDITTRFQIRAMLTSSQRELFDAQPPHGAPHGFPPAHPGMQTDPRPAMPNERM